MQSPKNILFGWINSRGKKAAYRTVSSVPVDDDDDPSM